MEIIESREEQVMTRDQHRKFHETMKTAFRSVPKIRLIRANQASPLRVAWAAGASSIRPNNKFHLTNYLEEINITYEGHAYTSSQ
ncbi:hypothetical protein GCM10007386_11350 [Pseudoduganella dura]|nr:hypothetical protein GCM10007386_11350 [Pseudoduganella dura]